MALYNWTGASTDSYSLPANFYVGGSVATGLPGASDDVAIDPDFTPDSGSSYPFTRNPSSGTVTCNHLYSGESISFGSYGIDGGTHNISAGSNFSGTINGGTFNLGSGVTIQFFASVNGGTFNGAGKVYFAQSDQNGPTQANCDVEFDGDSFANYFTGVAQSVNACTKRWKGGFLNDWQYPYNSTSIPSASNTRAGTVTAATTGTVVLPAQGSVSLGVGYGAGGTEFTGIAVLTQEAFETALDEYDVAKSTDTPSQTINNVNVSSETLVVEGQ